MRLPDTGIQRPSWPARCQLLLLHFVIPVRLDINESESNETSQFNEFSGSLNDRQVKIDSSLIQTKQTNLELNYITHPTREREVYSDVTRSDGE